MRKEIINMQMASPKTMKKLFKRLMIGFKISPEKIPATLARNLKHAIIVSCPALCKGKLTGLKRVMSECHATSEAATFRKDRPVHMTGYALCDDTMWRPHSWLRVLTPKGIFMVVETTPVARLSYVGIPVNTPRNIENMTTQMKQIQNIASKGTV